MNTHPITRPRVGEILNEVFEFFNVKTEKRLVYESRLSFCNSDLASLKKAVDISVESDKFCPTISDLKKGYFLFTNKKRAKSIEEIYDGSKGCLELDKINTAVKRGMKYNTACYELGLIDYMDASITPPDGMDFRKIAMFKGVEVKGVYSEGELSYILTPELEVCDLSMWDAFQIDLTSKF